MGGMQSPSTWLLYHHVVQQNALALALVAVAGGHLLLERLRGLGHLHLVRASGWSHLLVNKGIVLLHGQLVHLIIPTM